MHPKYFQRFQIFYTPEGDGAPAGGGGSAAPTPAPAAAPPAPPASAVPAPTAGTGAPAGGAVVPPTPPQFSYGEDRSNWIPQDRFSEVTRERKQFKDDAERYRRMMEAGTGVNIPGRPEPVNPEIERARAAIFEVLGPDISEGLQLLAKHRQQLGQMMERAPELLHSTERIWGAQAQRTVDTMLSEIAKDFGAAELNPYQQKMYVRAFADFVASSPQLTDRYERQDPKVITEFLTELRAQTFDPLRRRAQAPAVPGGGAPRIPGQPRALPQAPRSSGVIPQGAPPPAVRTEDEVHDAAAARFFAEVGGRGR